jgi:hypothetical protein
MINSASLRSLASRYDNPIPTRFPAPIDCLKIPALFPADSWIHTVFNDDIPFILLLGLFLHNAILKKYRNVLYISWILQGLNQIFMYTISVNDSLCFEPLM